MKLTDERLHEAMQDPGFPLGSYHNKVAFLQRSAGCTHDYAKKFYDDWWAKQEAPTLSSGYEGFISSDPMEDAEIHNALYYVKPADVVFDAVDDIIVPHSDALSPINPAHYRQGDIECIDAIRAQLSDEEFVGYLRGNIAKYTWRLRGKGDPVENAKKAQKYMEWLIEELS